MRYIVIIFILLCACAAPIQQTSITYSGTDGMAKIVQALVDTKWEITFTDTENGLITAKKLTSGEQFASSMGGETPAPHIATITFKDNTINVSVNQQKAHPLGAGDYKCKDLGDEIIKRFHELTER